MSQRPSDQSVRNALSAVLKTLDPPQSLKTLHKLSGGYANLVYDVNNRYVLRVFFRQGWEANFASEKAALEMLQLVPNVPRVLASGILQLEWPCPYLLLNKFPGTHAFDAWRDVSLDTQEEWAKRIASLLRQAHSIQVPAYGSLLKVADTVDNTACSSWQQKYDRKMESLLAQTSSASGDVLRIVDKAKVNYESNRAALVYQAGPRLIHCDVRLHNVIVENATVTGLIDWEWAQGGEPDRDLVNLFRFALFPSHVASGVETPISREMYAPLLKFFLMEYSELLAIPELTARLTIYLVTSDLGQLGESSPILHRNALERLDGWLYQGLVEQIIAHPGN